MTLPKQYRVACHTDNVGPGSTFVAIKGVNTDGAKFIGEALHRGADKIIVDAASYVDESIKHLCANANVPLIVVDNSRKELAILSAQAVDFPAQKLRIIAITGTKGKTTSSFMLEHALRSVGYKTALLSTVHNKINGVVFPTHLTTQQPDYIHTFLKQCVDQKIDYVIMEVAAQAVSLWRVYGIEFDAILFTNFAQEHGEFYFTQNDYLEAKKSLLKQIKKNGVIVLNGDNQECLTAAPIYDNVQLFGQQTQAHYRIHIEKKEEGKNFFSINKLGNQSVLFYSPLIGQFNVYNWVGVMAVLDSLGLIELSAMNKTVESFFGAPGRLELYILPNGAHCYIDYAHNPLSFQEIFSTLRPYTDNLIAVFGAGGDRDASRRPIMGKVAAAYADAIILTSDNPRSEDPKKIAEEILEGIGPIDKDKVSVVLDRTEAIKKAYHLSNSSSVIILLGKGAEHYQIVKAEKHPFCESAIVQALR